MNTKANLKAGTACGNKARAANPNYWSGKLIFPK